MTGMNRLPLSKRVQIISLLTEGMSMRAISRVVDCSLNTVTKLLEATGAACSAYQSEHLRDLPCKRIQVTRFGRSATPRQERPSAKSAPDGAGDVWTWMAICADTKLVPCWLVGPRDGEYALEFIDDLRQRLAHRVQLTTDGHKPYLEAVEEAFGDDIDYAMLVKLYGSDGDGAPNKLNGSTALANAPGRADDGHRPARPASISDQLRRAAKPHHADADAAIYPLTNAFSKKVENHERGGRAALHALQLRSHPQDAARHASHGGRVTDRLWSMEDIAALVEAAAPKPGPRGPYKKRGSSSHDGRHPGSVEDPLDLRRPAHQVAAWRSVVYEPIEKREWIGKRSRCLFR